MFLDAVFARIPSVRARLVLLTVLLCGLMASLALAGMVLLSQSNESLRTVYDDRVVPLQQLKTVADLYAVNIVDTSHKVRNGNLSWSAGHQLVQQAGAEVQATWKAYTATYLVPEEVRLVEDVLPLMQRADAMRDRLQRVLAAQDEPGLTSLVKEELYQTIDPVSDKLNALVAVQLTVAKQEYLAGLGRYERARWGAWLGLGLACLIGSLLAGVISTRIMRSLGAEPSAVREVVQGIAKGSLNQTLPVAQGDVSSVMAFMHGMQHALAQLVREVRNNAHELHAASSQIAQGNMDLSSRTEETAVTAQRASAKLDEVTERLQQRILNSGQARVLAQGVLTVGDRVGTQMAALMQAMEGINDSARRIVDIIGVIDSIAFQTNILALNASVESARAGEQGRGFAVVASEVRALATRSAEAAREIKTLIASASERTESGARQVDGTSQTLGAMMDELRTLSELMRRIDLNADTDSQDIEQLHLQVRELDRVAQRNAALVEEMAASSESLKDQAGRLHTAVQVFSV